MINVEMDILNLLARYKSYVPGISIHNRVTGNQDIVVC